LPARLESDWRIHLAHVRGINRPRRRNVVGRELTFKKGEVSEHDGLRLTSMARTFLDLAQFIELRDLVAIADYLICEHGPEHPYPRAARLEMAELLDVVRRHPGKRGVKMARAALDLARVGADSRQESHLRLLLLDAGLPEPALDHVIRDEEGFAAAWPDLAYPDWRIAIQYDGEVHDHQVQYLRDIERNRRTQSAGWTEVRLKKGDLDGDRPRAVVLITEALRASGWRP